MLVCSTTFSQKKSSIELFIQILAILRKRATYSTVWHAVLPYVSLNSHVDRLL
jgi:hypothetical protein